MVRALVGDSTMTSVVPAPARFGPAFGFGALAAGALAAGLTLAAGSRPSAWAWPCGFDAGEAFAAGFGGADFGFADFFDLELAIGLVIEPSVWPRRPRKSLATKDGRDRMARREGQSTRGPEAQAARRGAIQPTISAAATAGSSPSVRHLDVGLRVVGLRARAAGTCIRASPRRRPGAAATVPSRARASAVVASTFR